MSGFGYGVLCGAVQGAEVFGNTFVGSANRGRHAVYFSSGASFCRATNNTVSNFEKDGITIYATDEQPSCTGNIVEGNTLISCADAFTSGAISLAQNVQQTSVVGNIIRSSGGCGIKSDGTGSTKHTDNHFRDNLIIDSQFIGIDLIALRQGTVTGNVVHESSRESPGTYSNIRCVSDGVTATSGILISENRSTGDLYARSAFQTNATPPVPTAITLLRNHMTAGRVAQYEILGGTAEIDGRIWGSGT
jgi:hypothetical protein